MPRAIELYKEALDVDPDKTSVLYKAVQGNLANALSTYACDLPKGENGVIRDLPRAIGLYKEALDVHPDKTSVLYKAVQGNLANTISTYARGFYNGTNGVTRDLPRAIELYKEALDLHPDKASVRVALSLTLNTYAADFSNGTNGVARDMPRAIELYKEALDVYPDKMCAFYKNIQIKLASALNTYAFDLYNA